MNLFLQDDGKGGLSLRGVAFMTVLAVLTVLRLCQETVLTVLAVWAVVAVSVMTAPPLKLSPLFRDPDFLVINSPLTDH